MYIYIYIYKYTRIRVGPFTRVGPSTSMLPQAPFRQICFPQTVFALCNSGVFLFLRAGEALPPACGLNICGNNEFRIGFINVDQIELLFYYSGEVGRPRALQKFEFLELCETFEKVWNCWNELLYLWCVLYYKLLFLMRLSYSVSFSVYMLHDILYDIGVYIYSNDSIECVESIECVNSVQRFNRMRWINWIRQIGTATLRWPSRHELSVKRYSEFPKLIELLNSTESSNWLESSNWTEPSNIIPYVCHFFVCSIDK